MVVDTVFKPTFDKTNSLVCRRILNSAGRDFGIASRLPCLLLAERRAECCTLVLPTRCLEAQRQYLILVLFKTHLYHPCLREKPGRAILALLDPYPIHVEVGKHEFGEVGDRLMENIACLTTRLRDFVQLLQIETLSILLIF